MAINPKFLNDGEQIVFSTRTHWKALIVPGLVLLVTVVLAGFLSSVPDSHRNVWLTLIWVVAAVVLAIFSLWPFLEWRGATFTVTNRRLTTHAGVLNRTGHDIPLSRISDVTYEKGLVDRLLGCGTLRVSDASDKGAIELHDVPRVEKLQLMLSDQLFQQSRDDGA